MPRHVVGLEELDRSQVAIAGGKGANLGELLRIEGVRVPAGFCVTTAAFDTVAQSPETRRDPELIRIPDDLATHITDALEHYGATLPYAVRSSATTEDLPSASFAGQHDSYLNVVGPKAVLEHVSRCWASLFTERASAYRVRGDIDHREVRMAVVVQRMVAADVSGVLFTADPLSGNRKVTCIEATFGLGEALVSGQVNADRFQTREGRVTSRAEHQDRPTLTDTQLLELTRLGRRIEAHFGSPQDIEWCLDSDGFWIVQSRPITTLFPVPETDEQGTRVYLSVGHQQMMTDAMKPLGLSMWRLTTPAPAREAGGRLFVDATRILSSPATRASFVKGWSGADPLVWDALQTVIDRPGFIPTLTEEAPAGPPAAPATPPLETDRSIVLELIAQSEESLTRLSTTSKPRRVQPESPLFTMTSRSCAGSSSTGAAIRCSCRRWKPAGGSTNCWRRCSASGTRSTLSPNPWMTTSPLKWGWPCWTSPTSSARIRRWCISSSRPRTRTSWNSCLRSTAAAKRVRRSRPFSAGTACGVPVKSTSPARVGANVRRRSSR